MKKNIEEFIKSYCTQVYSMPLADLELKMDNHKCIIWESVEYFIPDNNSLYTTDDNLIWEFLTECYYA